MTITLIVRQWNEMFSAIVISSINGVVSKKTIVAQTSQFFMTEQDAVDLHLYNNWKSILIKGQSTSKRAEHFKVKQNEEIKREIRHQKVSLHHGKLCALIG